MTTVPRFSAVSLAVMRGFSSAAMPFMISPPMMSSGMKTSSQANLSPRVVIAERASSRTASGASPASRRSFTILRAPSSSMARIASVSSVDIQPPTA